MVYEENMSGMETEKVQTVTVRIPTGLSCMMDRNRGKVCVFAKYSAKHGGYNCRIYGRILRGGGVSPMKCDRCLTGEDMYIDQEKLKSGNIGKGGESDAGENRQTDE